MIYITTRSSRPHAPYLTGTETCGRQELCVTNAFGVAKDDYTTPAPMLRDTSQSVVMRRNGFALTFGWFRASVKGCDLSLVSDKAGS